MIYPLPSSSTSPRTSVSSTSGSPTCSLRPHKQAEHVSYWGLKPYILRHQALLLLVHMMALHVAKPGPFKGRGPVKIVSGLTILPCKAYSSTFLDKVW